MIYYNLAIGSIGEDRYRYAQLAYRVWEELCRRNPDSRNYANRLSVVVQTLMV